jgi:hypothetical protein
MRYACACVCPSDMTLRPSPSLSCLKTRMTRCAHSESIIPPPPLLHIAQVLIIEFEIIDDSLEMLHAAINELGLDQYIYRRSTDIGASCKYEWPTLDLLIVYNMHLVIFAHSNGMDTSCASVVCPEGMFYTFDHFQQTNWNDNTCNLLMNHWMNEPETDLPWEGNTEEFNRYNLLSDRFRLCTVRAPNIIGINFWSIGDVLDLVTEVNRNRAGGGGGRPVAKPIPWIEGGN